MKLRPWSVTRNRVQMVIISTVARVIQLIPMAMPAFAGPERAYCPLERQENKIARPAKIKSTKGIQHRDSQARIPITRDREAIV